MAGHEPQALWALAAGELETGAKARVEAHVAACAACSDELRRVVEARALLHTAREVAPAVRWEETGARLKAAAATRMAMPERRFLSPWALTLAGACAVALVLWLGSALMARRNAGLGTSTVAVQAPRDVEGSSGSTPAHPPVDARKDPAVVATGPGSTPTTGDAQKAQETIAARADAASTTEVERVTGAVVREVTGSEHALESGTRLRSGMAVRTLPKASAVLRLPDESRVRLSAGSDVLLARAETNAVHLTVQQGRLSVTASHARREGFLVESAGLRVTVVGTVFSVERTSRGAAVAVLEGRVRVDAEGQPPRFVDAGERVELTQAGGALRPRALSAGDRQAFHDLRAAEPRPTVASVQSSRKEPTRTDVVPAPKVKPDTAVASKSAQSQPTNNSAPRQSFATAANPLEAPAPPTEAIAPAPESPPSASDTAVATAPTRPSPSDDDFVPYPGSSGDALAPSALGLTPGAVQAPSIAAVPPPPPRRRKTLGMLVPGGLLSDDSDERFLGYARLQSHATTCGRFLVGLGEIAEASPRSNHREEARSLRGRCFTKQRQPVAAEDEYRQYLREFPSGRYAPEARVALGLPVNPASGTPESAPAPLPVTPRWNAPGSPQRTPVSPGVPRRW
ncbi:VgrG protein [Corallococcus praedator]|uniref:VgrG protein n=1 Tax=Corallococcus praedator TaxID=2316724 RepID=A0ABX9QMW0_9BACT|nr:MULTISPECIES: FecR domain-containing protein [Corallococcus]RKH32594.1 VgrG protein [Corallococcus sp. CA031C]RKI13173.1 VgrG protein [Corallococcus praedator]